MQNISISMAVTVVLFFTSLHMQGHAHSFLTSPPAFRRAFRVGNKCVGSECTSACPVINPNGFNMDNTASRPARTWKRGQRVKITWTKNNHEGGLIRFALVPANVAPRRNWHSRFAFYYGCWEQGRYTCRGERACGTDTGKKAFSRTITVPAVFPDGVYVMGMVWYGGLDFKREKGKFADYYSCSFVRIRGGAAVTQNFQPFWAPGNTGKFKRNNKCLTSSVRVGRCGRFGCGNVSAFYGIDTAFQNGKKPGKITSAAVRRAFNV